jgi:hypothetical protein
VFGPLMPRTLLKGVDDNLATLDKDLEAIVS